MDQTVIYAARLLGTIDITTTMALSDAARKVGDALSLSFSLETTGYYEEYPAWVAEGCGLKFALLGPPRPEDDVRDDRSQGYQLLIDSEWSHRRPGHRVDVSALFAEFIEERSGLRCEPLETPHSVDHHE